MHFRLPVSRGVKGRELMAAPQPAHCQLPDVRGFSLLLVGVTAGPKPSSKSGSPASPASKGMSGASLAVDISGACGCGEFPPFCFP